MLILGAAWLSQREKRFKVCTPSGKRVAPPTKDECFDPSRLPSFLSAQERRVEMAEQISNFSMGAVLHGQAVARVILP